MTLVDERQDPLGSAVHRPADPVDTFRSIYPGLLMTGRRLTSSHAEAEDLVQEAIVQTLAHHPDFEGVEHPSGYVRTVVFRAAFKRRQIRWTEVPLESQQGLVNPSPGPEDQAVLIEALAHLPPRQRVCLTLRHRYGLSDEAIAETLACATSTVRSQIARALARLRTEMEVSDDLDT